MPIYEYRCANDHSFEVFQSMSEDSLTVCVECGAVCERVLSAPAVHFKGSGFYTTDYARKGEKQAASNEDGSGSSDKSSSEKSSSDKGSSDKGSSDKGSSDSGSSKSSASEKSSSSSSSGD